MRVGFSPRLFYRLGPGFRLFVGWEYGEGSGLFLCSGQNVARATPTTSQPLPDLC